MGKLLSLGLFALTKLPMEKLFYRRRDPTKALEELEANLLTNDRLSSLKQHPAQAAVAEKEKETLPLEQAGVSRVTNAETIRYQKRELGKVIMLLELHLQQKCKINGKACDCCLPMGTMIYSNPGIGAIESPVSKVITHTGKARGVTKMFEREYNGVLNELSIGYTNIPLRLTPEHQVLVATGVRKRQKDTWRKRGISEDSLRWVPAIDLGDRDFIAFPRLKGTLDRVDIDTGFAELLGWYLAEGSCTGNRITFSLGKGEPRNISRVRSLIRDKFKVEPKVYQKPTVVHICYTNKRDAAIFREFGLGARNKALPQWLLLLPPYKQRAFLKGAFEGDGHVAKYYIVYTTTSEILAYQLRLLLFRLGLLHSVMTRGIGRSRINGRIIVPRGPRYDLTIAGDAARALDSSFSGGSRTSGNHGWISDNFAFLPIKSNKQESFSGMVYNIAVEEDESYLTIHGAIHNCEKHPIVIEGLAEETLGMTGDKLYEDVIAWAKKITPITTEEASRSGKYDNIYPDLAVEGRNIRKRIMGTADIKALLSPQLSEKVSGQVQKILDRAMKNEGGKDDPGRDEPRASESGTEETV